MAEMLARLRGSARTAVIAVGAAAALVAVPALAIVAIAGAVDDERARPATAWAIGFADPSVTTAVVTTPSADVSPSAEAGSGSFVTAGPAGSGTLAGSPMDVASVTVRVPAAGTVLLTAQVTFQGQEGGGMVSAQLAEGPSMKATAYWNARVLGGPRERHQQLTVAVPVNPGAHTYTLNLSESADGAAYSTYFAGVTAAYFAGEAP